MNGETILVVDDNKEIVYSISELLKYEGYQIVKAYDGMEALKALETNQIDLILLDVMMPKLNGLSALMISDNILIISNRNYDTCIDLIWVHEYRSI